MLLKVRKRKFKKLIERACNYKVTKPQFKKLYAEYKQAFKALKGTRMEIKSTAKVNALNYLRDQEKSLAKGRLQGTRRSIKQMYLSSKLGSFVFTRKLIKREFSERSAELANKYFNTDQLL